MPGDSGVTVVTNARVYYTTRAAAGASGARHSLRPLISESGTNDKTSRETGGEIAKLCLAEMRAYLFPRSGRGDQQRLLFET